MTEHEHTQTTAAEADSKWAAIVARLDDVSPESREAAGEAVMDAYLLGLERGAARAAAAASGSTPRAQAEARPVDLWLGPPRRDTVRLADLDLQQDG